MFCFLNKLNRFTLLSIIFMVLLASCLKKREGVSWDTNVLTPIAKSQISIKDFIADSLYDVTDDSSLVINYRKELKNIKIDTIVPLDGNAYVERVLISEFPITTKEVHSYINGLDLISSLPATQQAFFKFLDGNMSTIPAIPNLSTPAQVLNADNVFTSADLKAGYLVNTIRNDLPVAITDIQYTIKNATSGVLIGMGNIPVLNPGQTVRDSINLSGKVIEGKLSYQVNHFNISGSNGNEVLISLSKGLDIKIVASDLLARKLTAVFPKQDFIYQEFETNLTDIGDKKLEKVKVKSGKIRVDYVSTSPDTVFFTYKIPNALSGLDTFVFKGKFDPAPMGTTVSGVIEKDINDFEIDLTGIDSITGNKSYNTFKSTLSAGFDSTGRMVTITESDSIHMEIRLLDVVPTYAKGYFGKDSFIVGPESIDFDALEGLNKGDIIFEEAKLNLNIKSGAGIDAKVKLVAINGVNASNQSVPLTLDKNDFFVPAAIESPFKNAEVTFQIDQNNSNIVAFINNFPKSLTYQVDVETNPNVDTTNVNQIPFNNFLNENSSFDIDLVLEIPMKVRLDHLTLKDTTEMVAFNLENLENIQNGTISLLIDNEMPLEFGLNIVVLDQLNNPIDTIGGNGLAAAANTDPITKKVISPVKSKIDYTFDLDRLQRLLSGKKLVVNAVVNTGQREFVKLFSDSRLKINLVGQFNYLIGAKR